MHPSQERRNHITASALRIAAAIVTCAIFIVSWAPFGKSEKTWQWWTEFAAAGALLPTFIIVLMAMPGIRRAAMALAICPGWIKRIRQRQWLFAAAFCMLLLGCLGSIYLYKRLPSNGDEFAQMLQARIFLSGEWRAESHPLRGFFPSNFVINDGRLYAQYPPGHPLMLALGQLVGAPWLVNPLLGTLCIVIVYFLTLEVAGLYAARMAALLFMASPFVLVLASSHMNHMTALTCLLLFTLFYIRTHKYGRTTDAALAGLALGYLCITRPQLALPYTIPFMLHWILYTFRQRPRVFWRSGITLSAMTLLGVGFLLYYNAQTTGDPLVTGYQRRGNTGLNPLMQMLAGTFEFESAFRRLSSRWRGLHTNLFGWPASSLVFVWLLFQMQLGKRYCGLLVAGALSVSLSMLLTQFHDPIFWPRYLFEAGIVCLVLTAAALSRMSVYFTLHFNRRMRLSQTRTLFTLMILALIALAIPYHMVDKFNHYSTNYWRNRPEIYKALSQPPRTPALIFVKQRIEAFTASLFYPISATPGDVITARSKGRKNQGLIAMYPDRYIYYYQDGRLHLVKTPQGKKKHKIKLQDKDAPAQSKKDKNKKHKKDKKNKKDKKDKKNKKRKNRGD